MPESAAPFCPEPKALLRGWYLGGEEFRKELLSQMNERRGPEHFGPEIRKSEEQKANRLIATALKGLGWKPGDLVRSRKGAPEKVQIALRLRRETTMTLEWISKRLNMGTKTHLSHLLWHDKNKS